MVDIFVRYPRGKTKTGKAISYTEQALFSHTSTTRKQELIVITDGKSTDNVHRPAEHLKQKGVEVMSVGVGHSYSKHQLEEISTTTEEVFTVEFSGLQHIISKMLNHACKPGMLPCL